MRPGGGCRRALSTHGRGRMSGAHGSLMVRRLSPVSHTAVRVGTAGVNVPICSCPPHRMSAVVLMSCRRHRTASSGSYQFVTAPCAVFAASPRSPIAPASLQIHRRNRPGGPGIVAAHGVSPLSVLGWARTCRSLLLARRPRLIA